MNILHKYFVPAVGIPVGVLICIIWLYKPASASTALDPQQVAAGDGPHALESDQIDKGRMKFRDWYRCKFHHDGVLA